MRFALTRSSLSAALFVLALAACGGGGGSSAGGTPGGGTDPVPVTPKPDLPPALSLIAGNAGGGSYARDGAGAEARFASAAGIAIDSSGNFYVADGSALRKVTPAGVVTTVALKDTAGQPASLLKAGALCFDRGGNLYVLDSVTVRKITPAGVMSTLAGDEKTPFYRDGPPGATGFYLPRAITADAQGNLYVTDSADVGGKSGPVTYIRKVTPDGAVSAPVRLDDAGGEGMGIQVDGAGNLYLAMAFAGNITGRQAYNRVVKIAPDGANTVLAGAYGSGMQGSVDGTGGAAQFNAPAGLAADAQGQLLVSEKGGIRQVTPAGVVTTLAGSQMQSGGGPLVLDRDGNPVFIDGPLLRKYAAAAVTTLAGAAFAPRIYGSADGAGAAAQFTNPQNLAADAAGNIYVADTALHVIRKITPAGLVTTLAGAAGTAGSADGAGAAARFNLPQGLAVHPSGNLYVADAGNSTIRKITPAGAVSTVAGLAGTAQYVDGQGSAARFIRPIDIVADAQGALFIVDANAASIRKMTAEGLVSTYIGSDYGYAEGTGSTVRFGGMRSIAIDKADNLYVHDLGNGRVRKITPAGVTTTFSDLAVAMPRATYGSAAGMALDVLGNVYLGVQGGVLKLGTDGKAAIVAGVPGQEGIQTGNLPGSMFTPLGLVRIASFSLALSSGSSILRLDLP